MTAAHSPDPFSGPAWEKYVSGFRAALQADDERRLIGAIETIMTATKPFPGSERCPAPKMTEARGRTWDACKVIDATGRELAGYLDTRLGSYFYFEAHDGWRKGSVSRFMTGGGNVADFRRAERKREGKADATS